jgi:hypothetical protein
VHFNIMSREQSVGFEKYKVNFPSEEDMRREVGALAVHWKCFTAEMQSHITVPLRKMIR